MSTVTPERWYRLFWIAVELVRLVVLLLAARWLLVRPIVRAIERGKL